MRKRKRESVLRTNKVKLTVDSEKYYHSLLMLFFPWHSEENLKGTFETYEEQFIRVTDTLWITMLHTLIIIVTTWTMLSMS